MPLVEHLEELRGTVVRIALILLAAFAACYALGDRITGLLLKPLLAALEDGGGGRVVHLGVLDKVLARLQVAFWSSIVVSCPLWFHQVWLFVRPGLHEHEARAVRPFLVLGLLLFCAGVAFGYFLVFPLAFRVLLDFGAADVEAAIGLRDHIVLSSKALVFLGLAFQFPNVLLVLGFMGLVTRDGLRARRRYVHFGLALLSAALTPPDPYTMLGLWAPLALLFEAGVLAVALVVHPWRRRRGGG